MQGEQLSPGLIKGNFMLLHSPCRVSPWISEQTSIVQFLVPVQSYVKPSDRQAKVPASELRKENLFILVSGNQIQPAAQNLEHRLHCGYSSAVLMKKCELF